MAAQRQRGQLTKTIESLSSNRDWLDRFPAGCEVVYFVRCGHATKIGHTNNLRDRVLSLQHASPSRLHIIRVVPGPRKLELQAHVYFQQWRMHGEWFRIEQRAIHKFCDSVDRGEDPKADHKRVKAAVTRKEEKIKAGIHSAHTSVRVGRLVKRQATPEELARMRPAVREGDLSA